MTGARFAVAPGLLTDIQLSALESGKGLPDIDALDDTLVFQLRQSGILIPTNLDEFDILEAQYKAIAHNPHIRRVQAILTRSCNLRCQYCYQDKTVRDARSDAQQTTLRYLHSQIIPGGVLIVTWFGGEPLLKFNLICHMSDSLILACAAGNTEFIGTISTNGVLLDRRKIQLLVERKVRNFQITLDGPPAIQEARRPACDGTPTYETIVNNIELLAEADTEIHIKVVVDRGNYLYIPELFRDLGRRGILPHVKIAIQETEAKFAASAYRGRFGSLEQFARVKMELLNHLLDEGYKIPEPTQRAEFCAATSPYCTAIDMAGNIYRCGSEFTNRIGSLAGNGIQVLTNASYDALFTNRGFAQWEMCKSCKVLPICGGGCTLALEGLAERQVCSFFKSTIKDYLLLLNKQDTKNINGNLDRLLTHGSNKTPVNIS